MIEVSQNIDDLKLWGMFIAGNQEAVGELYKRLFHKLFLFCYGYTKNKEEAKDIVQDAFRKLIEQRNAEIYDVEGWLKNTARFIWRTENRNGKNRKESLKDYKDILPKQTKNHTTIDAHKLQEKIDQILNPTNAKVIHLAAQGFKNREIAEELGITEKQVRNRKSESRKKIKRLIGEE